MCNKKKPKCEKCGYTTYIVSHRYTFKDVHVGYYCKNCNTLFSKKGINTSKIPLYLGLRKVNNTGEINEMEKTIF